MSDELEVVTAKLEEMTKRAVDAEEDVANGMRELLVYRKTLEVIALQRDDALNRLKKADVTIRMMIARR
jgi:hypothetical protein